MYIIYITCNACCPNMRVWFICTYIYKIALVHIFLKPIFFLYVISSRSDRKANEKPKCHWSDVQNIWNIVVAMWCFMFFICEIRNSSCSCYILMYSISCVSYQKFFFMRMVKCFFSHFFHYILHLICFFKTIQEWMNAFCISLEN